MSRRILWIILIVFGLGVAGVWGAIAARRNAQQRTAQVAVALATQLGYQPQDLLLEHQICPDATNFGQKCWWKLHFQTSHTIAEMQTLLEHVPCTHLFDEPIGGHYFVNEFISNNPDRLLANDQDLFEVQDRIPQPSARDWSCVTNQLPPMSFQLYETSATTNRYTFRGQVISKNIATVSVFIQ